MSAYAQPADMLNCYDARQVGQLSSDTGTPVTPTNLLTDPILAALLLQASGQIEMAALTGGRYAVTDLENLTDNSQAFLIRLTCDIAMYYLALRRGKAVEEFPQAVAAMQMLDQIQMGDRVFNVAAVIDAGHAQVDTLDVLTIADENLLRDAVKMFPARRYTVEQV